MYIMTLWLETPCGFLDTIISDDSLTFIFKACHTLSMFLRNFGTKLHGVSIRP
jgi:hypothetical protein